MAIVKITLSEDEVKLIKNISNDDHIPENILIKKLVLDGLDKYKIDRSIYMYENRKVNLNTASYFAGLSLRDFMNELESRGVALNLTPEMVTYSLDILAKAFDNKELQTVLNSEK